MLRRFQRWVLVVAVAASLIAVIHVVRTGTPEPETIVESAPRLPPFDPRFDTRLRPLDEPLVPTVVRTDFPMGSENGAFSYDAQPFLTTRHLGSDWNGIGGWNSDRGDPVYAVADGLCVYSGDAAGGWGNIVVLAHRLPGGQVVQSFYGHLESRAAVVGDLVPRGQEVGTVGTAGGQYLAHLHFEVRRRDGAAPGSGYGDTPEDRLNPTRFVDRFGREREAGAFVPAAALLDRPDAPEIRLR